MARFDVYRLARKHPEISYFLDVQATNLADQIPTRLVIPLVKRSKSHERADRIHLSFEVMGEECLAYFPEIGSVLVEQLGPKVCSLEKHHTEIVDAIDFLLQGF